MDKDSPRSKQEEFRSFDAYLRHYYPKPQPKVDGERDICAAAQQLAAGTLRSVRKQLAAKP
jgi:hypothetical protein